MKPGIVRSRVFVSRLFGVVVLGLILFTAGSFKSGSLLDVSLELLGYLLLTVAAFGRLWSLMYISGNKGRELIRTGPYSMMRHPLYFFSFVGFLGIALVSKNLLVFAVVVVFYAAYYPWAVMGEEKKLIGLFGQAYADYQALVPAVLPRLSLYRAESHYNVNMAKVVRRVGDATWFVWVFVVLQGIQALQHWGVLPVICRVP